MNKRYIYISVLFISVLLLFIKCKDDFLEQNPIGPISDGVLANKEGVNLVLVGAYSMLDGYGGNTQGGFGRAVSNWHFGSIAGGDAHKGSDNGDQAPIGLIENHSGLIPTNTLIDEKWQALYDGAQAANDVVRLLGKVDDGSLTTAEADEIKAEAIFIRTVFLFEATKMWGNIPYVDENITIGNQNYFIPNNESILPKLEEDLLWATQHLNPVQDLIGRANSWAAKALLGKLYMYDQKFAEAQSILTDVVENGLNPVGVKYGLVENFQDNFNPVAQNNEETVFAVQHSVNDGGSGYNGNAGDILNFIFAGPCASCCGFFQPSFDLVNSYKTDPLTGLPLVESYDDEDLKHDWYINPDSAFVPYDGTIDPRLDWTAGRRGIPFFDYGINPGASWARDREACSPYIAMKSLYWKKDKETMSGTYGEWDQSNQATSNNYNIIRFADVLLLAAEAEVESGSLDKAQEYVNRVRARAANPVGFVYSYKNNEIPEEGFTDTPAANYLVKEYPAGYFVSQGKEKARELVHFERKIELALEGHRFFDLQRWDKTVPGSMADEINHYMAREIESVPEYKILNSGTGFIEGKHEVYPIPQSQIDRSVNEDGDITLFQNPGY